MPSLLPGFEYDIFISYRQHDNKSDGWVTEFVAHLREELEATLKDKITLYFDSNPVDGLQESHLVDQSLSPKINSLIFIPILSQTYCDPRSFAWNNEFLAFNKMVGQDPFGPVVRLSNGNVASRILPVRIHELDTEDVVLLENELKNKLRAIDFIFKSPGVNRPLKPNDSRADNSNHTFYRDQINKVANAIKDILSGLRNFQPRDEDLLTKSISSPPRRDPDVLPASRKKIAIASIVLLVMAIAFYCFFVFGRGQNAAVLDIDKSIAIIPFQDLSNDKSQEYFGDGVAEMIRTSLSKVKDVSVTSMRSVLQYRDSKKTIPQIGKELNVAHVLEGSIMKEGNSVRVVVQLIDVRNDKHLWSETYDGELKEIFKIQTEIAQQISNALQLKLTQREASTLALVPETSLASYDYVMAAQHSLNRMWETSEDRYRKEAEGQFRKAMAIDSTSLEARLGLAKSIAARSYFGQGSAWWDSAQVIANQVLKMDPTQSEAYYISGRASLFKHDKEHAKINLEKAIAFNHNNSGALSTLGLLYTAERNFKKGIPMQLKALKLEPNNPDRANNFYNQMGWLMMEVSRYSEAEELMKKQIALYPDEQFSYQSVVWLLWVQGKHEELQRVTKELVAKYPLDSNKFDDLNYLDSRAFGYFLAGDFEAAEPLYIKMLEKIRMGYKEVENQHHNFRHRLAYIWMKKGETEKARSLFREHIEMLVKNFESDPNLAFSQYDIAAAYACLGEKEKAYEWLEKMPYWNITQILIRRDPLFDPLRKEAQFQQLIAKQNAETEEITRVIDQFEVQNDLRLMLRK